ncbi:mu-protocadherin-cell-suface protein [Chthoniobacter flavus]|nr:mu-protocadherin-cell-suface protein [Chthoniobacter flavus]
MPSRGESNFNGGRVPSAPVNPPSTAGRPSIAGGAAELPSGNRPNAGINRPASLPAQPGAGISGVPRPGMPSAQRPSAPARNDVGNFLGVAGGVAAGSALANTAAQHSANREPATQRPAGPALRPEQRADWAARSQNRNPQWQERVENRNTAWNNWQHKNQERLNSFQQTRDQRWTSLETAQQNRQNWRNQNRPDWQQHRGELWGYRADRADEIRGRARDYYDGYFDDRWWGRCTWGYGYGYVGFGNYPANPWWWWTPAKWLAVRGFINGIASDPYYIDYGMNVIYDDDTVYVDDQPVPASQYTEPMVDLAVNAGQPPPPTPPAAGQPAEWMPLGVFALAQEEKGDPILFLQLSVSREGVMSGAYSSTLTNDQRPVAGMVDKASQRVVWRIGVNTDTIFETSLANLTQDVSPVAIHFGKGRTQIWLLVRMPEPALEGSPEAIPEISPTPPPLKAPAAASK